MENTSFRTQRNGQPLKRLANALQEHMGRYGYQLIETPIIDNAELFLTKAGDKVAEKLFTFERHGTILALRPEFTAAAADLYIHRNEHQPVRWQFSGPIFEDDPGRPHGRYQHFSAGAELIGLSGTVAEAEMIVMAIQGIIEQGIDDWQIVIGHVGLTRRLLSKFELDPRTQHFVLSHRDALKSGSKGKLKMLSLLARYLPDIRTTEEGVPTMSQTETQEMLDVLLNTSPANATMGGRTRHDIAQRLLKKRQQAAQRNQVDDAIYFLQGWMNIASSPQWAMDEVENYIGFDDIARELYEEWATVLKLLEAAGVSADQIVIQPDLARTWDYYTGIVFDIRTAEGVQLAGGGRYDELPRLIGGERDIPAVGFAYTVDHLLDLLPPSRVEDAPRLFHLQFDHSTQFNALRWATALRKRGLSLILTDDPQAMPKSAVILRIDAAGNAMLGQRTYTMSEIENLVNTLNG